jgi:hypothetical protein
MKTSIVMEPDITVEGVVFTLKVDYDFYDCLVPMETLTFLCQSKISSLDLLNAYRVHERDIDRVARRLIRQGVATVSPIIVEARFFR